MQNVKPNYDRVNLVDDNDKIIGEADKFVAHSGEGLLHQAVSLFLFRKNSQSSFELLIQKRSPQKIVGAKQWANTLCGNVAVGENHRDCVLRRLKQELGLMLPPRLEKKIQKLTIFSYQIPCNKRYSEREIDHLFGLFLTEEELATIKFQANPQEVSGLVWRDWQELKEQRKILNKTFTPWFEIFINKQEVLQTIDQFLLTI